MTIDLRIDSNEHGGYDIEFVASCDCGNKLKAIFPFGEPSVDFTCANCDANYSFNVNKGLTNSTADIANTNLVRIGPENGLCPSWSRNSF
jgi:hypothetical protein